MVELNLSRGSSLHVIYTIFASGLFCGKLDTKVLTLLRISPTLANTSWIGLLPPPRLLNWDTALLLPRSDSQCSSIAHRGSVRKAMGGKALVRSYPSRFVAA